MLDKSIRLPWTRNFIEWLFNTVSVQSSGLDEFQHVAAHVQVSCLWGTDPSSP